MSWINNDATHWRIASSAKWRPFCFALDLFTPLRWRHDGRDSVSNHQPHDCLLNRLFRRRSKKTSKLRVTGLCVWNSPVTGEFPTQMASNAEDVSIWWRHHAVSAHSSRTGCFRWDYRSAASHRCVLCRVALAAEETGTIDSRYSAVEYIEHNLKWRKLNFVPVTNSETEFLQLSHGNKYVQNFALFKISQTHAWKWPPFLFREFAPFIEKIPPFSRKWSNCLFLCFFFCLFVF